MIREKVALGEGETFESDSRQRALLCNKSVFHTTLKFVAQTEQQHVQLFMFSN